MTAHDEYDIASNVALKAHRQGLRFDANVLLREIVADLAQSGDVMPASTLAALRTVAAQLLMLQMELAGNGQPA